MHRISARSAAVKNECVLVNFVRSHCGPPESQTVRCASRHDRMMHEKIFIGGTGRSGSTVVGYLLGSHPEIWATIPREIRFVTDRGGLLDLVYGSGTRVASPAPARGGLNRQLHWLHAQILRRNRNVVTTTPERFVRRLEGDWWERRSPTGEPRGLHRGIEIQALEAAIAPFVDEFSENSEQAARKLVDTLLTPPAQRATRRTWADTTPQNAENAHRIVRLFPDAKVVHIVRDGRDTCASVLQKGWGPNDWFTALEWWRVGATKAHAAMQRIGPRNGHTLQLEALVERSRPATLHTLFEFLERDVTDSVMRFFDERVRPERAHSGRWADEVPADLRAKVNRRYEQIWRELNAAGFKLTPLD